MSDGYLKRKLQIVFGKPSRCLAVMMLIGWLLVFDLQASSQSLQSIGLPSVVPSPITNWPARIMRTNPSWKTAIFQAQQQSGQQSGQQAGLQERQQAGNPFDGEAAFKYLERICAIGRRVSTSQGMEQQIEFLTDHFTQLNGQVEQQRFKARDPSTGKMVELTNLIVRWNPDRNDRLLLCCHYDTRPFPDSDPINPQGLFIGANDGASGVAALCELGKHIEGLGDRYGIDFVFFDGEEFVFVYGRDPMFLGSTYFAQQYRKRKGKWKYLYGILLDMVGDADLQIYMEGNSLKYCPRLTRSIWTVAQQLGVKEFIPELRHTIRDDHLPLNEIGRIETCNIIDFDYPNPQVGNIYWHTEKDIPENCSADSLEKVGRVVLEWLRQFTQLNRIK